MEALDRNFGRGSTARSLGLGRCGSAPLLNHVLHVRHDVVLVERFLRGGRWMERAASERSRARASFVTGKATWTHLPRRAGDERVFVGVEDLVPVVLELVGKVLCEEIYERTS